MAGETTEKLNVQDFTAGFAFIAIAIAILVAWMWNGDWLSIPPILFLEFGVWGIFIGGILSSKNQESKYAASDSQYYLMWGFLLTILGVIWFANRYAAGLLPASIAIIMIFIGLFIVYMAWSRTKKATRKA